MSWQWGKRNKKIARKLREKLKKLGVSFGQICTDNWESVTSVFQEDNHKIGKKYTTDIEGNNTRLRHRIRRAVRKTCCFPKKLENHFKAFEIAFFLYQFWVYLTIIFWKTRPKFFPIILTTLSTILGFVPFVKDGQNEIFWFALGVGTIGGMLFSLLGILIYLPLLTINSKSVLKRN